MFQQLVQLMFNVDEISSEFLKNKYKIANIVEMCRNVCQIWEVLSMLKFVNFVRKRLVWYDQI